MGSHGFSDHFPRRAVELASGQQVSIIEMGPDDGPALILTHGGGVDHAVMTWGLAIDAFARAGYRVVAIDLPGYGKSPKSPRSYTTELVTDTLIELLDALKIEHATLAGLSMGGAGSIGAALAAPERIDRLILVGTWGVQSRVRIHPLVRWVIHSGLYAWGNRHIGRSKAMTAVLASDLLGRRVRPQDPIVAAIIAETQHPTARICFDEFQRSELQPGRTRTNFGPRLGTIRQPTLFVHGPRDEAVPIRDVRRAVESMPDATLFAPRGAGHWVPRGRPGAFNAAVLAFLRETEPRRVDADEPPAER